VRRLAAAGALVALLAPACGGGGDGGAPGASDGASSGDGSGLDIELASLDGGAPLRLADLDGPAVVNLWATWCTPCRAEMPAIDAVDRAVPGDEVRIVGVNIGDRSDDVEGFLAEVGVAFPQYRDPEGLVHARLGATGMPTTVFMDGGEVVDLHAGALTADELAAELADRYGVTVALP
jgi:thiol-disulfide isomerase/thioredoxin